MCILYFPHVSHFLYILFICMLHCIAYIICAYFAYSANFGSLHNLYVLHSLQLTGSKGFCHRLAGEEYDIAAKKSKNGQRSVQKDNGHPRLLRISFCLEVSLVLN